MDKRILKILIAVLIFSAIIIAIFILNKSSISSRYGKSLRQNNLVNTVKLHELGITGQRIKIGLLDSGFDLAHPALSKIKVIDKYDFANKDTVVADETSESLAAHGSSVLSVVGGYYEGELFGIAYNSEFYLAKAEIPYIESYREEFIAIKAIKWLDSSGVDIITNSLKFGKFEDEDYYHPEQMNGTTALITKAADTIVSNGVIFCTSVGNTYEEQWHIVEPPGDGFNVIAVGSIDKFKNVSFFSSCGPTTDGRIKPDLVAPGEAVYFANIHKTEPPFWFSHGTSLSSPIVAGISALILSCHPNLTPLQVKTALLQSSSNSQNPNNRIGWGIPDAVKAVTYFGPAFSNTPFVQISDNFLEINTHCISGFGVKNGTVKVHCSDSKNSFIEYTMNKVEENFYVCTVPFNKQSQLEFFLTAEDSTNQKTIFPHPDFGHHFTFNTSKGKLEEISFNRRKVLFNYFFHPF